MEPQEGIKLKTSVPYVPTEESPVSPHGAGKWAGWGIQLSGPKIKPRPLCSPPVGDMGAALQDPSLKFCCFGQGKWEHLTS